MLRLIGRASLVIRAYRVVLFPIINWLTLTFAIGARRAAAKFSAPSRAYAPWLLFILRCRHSGGPGIAVFHAARELSDLRREDYLDLLRSAALTFLRVNAALLLGALWTVPVGVAIGSNPRLSRIAQPLAQLAASIPATAFFPVILLFLIRMRGGLEIAAMTLMLLGTQWYILFNVIAGAMAIPTDLKEVAQIFRFDVGPLALLDFAGNFSVPGDRDGDRVRRRVERQHRGGVFSFSGKDRFGARAGKHHQPGQRFGAIRCVAGVDTDHGQRRGVDQSIAMAAIVPVGLFAI